MSRDWVTLEELGPRVAATLATADTEVRIRAWCKAAGHLGRRCEVEGCGRKHYGGGLCCLHWNRIRRTGRVGPSDLILERDSSANPWRGHLACPHCQSSYWTMPWDGVIAAGLWRCIECSVDFRVAEAAA